MPGEPERVWGEELRAPARPSGAPPPDERRAARRVPLRRHRLQRRAGVRERRASPGDRCIPSPSASSEPSFDESGYARDVARAFGSTHHEEILGIERARELVPEVLGRLDEPFARSFDRADVPAVPRLRAATSPWPSAATAATSCSPATIPSRRSSVAALVQRDACRRGCRAASGACADLAAGLRRQHEPRLPHQARAARRFAGPPPLLESRVAGPARAARGGGAARASPIAAEELYSEAIDAWESARATHVVRPHARVLHALLSPGRHPRQGRPRRR